MIKLTGSHNPVIKEIRSLRSKNGREERGIFFIEGSRFVEEAVQEAFRTDQGFRTGLIKGADDIRYIAVSDTYLKTPGAKVLIGSWISKGLKVYNITDSLFDSVSDTQNPQGILAVIGLNREQLSGARLDRGIVVILDGIRDPGNMGTIIRTADAAGCAGVVITAGCVDLFNPKVLRSTMGSVFHLPVLHCDSIGEAMRLCRELGFIICASYLDGSVSIYDADLSGNVAFVIGSEAEGISNDALNGADRLVRIPMDGRAESLNAAVAAGIMIFEAVRQRSVKPK